jgi:exosortase/archaeosortase family protein
VEFSIIVSEASIMARTALAFVKFAALLALPFSEFLFLRIMTVLNPPLSFSNNATMILMLVLFFMFLVSRGSGPFQLKRGWLALNLVIVGFHLYLLHHPGWSKDAGFGRQIIALPYLGHVTSLGVLGSSFLVFTGAGWWLRMIKCRPVELCFLGLAVFPHIVYPLCLERLWRYSSGMTTTLVAAALKILGYEMIPAAEPFALKHSLLSLKIYAPCSGLEGITFFVTVLSLVLMLDHQRFSRTRIVVAYAAGIAYMWFLNVLRILLIFIAGVWVSGESGREEGTRVAVNLFHANTGWLIYSAGIVLYLAVFLTLSGQKNPPASPNPGTSGGYDKTYFFR